MPENEEFLHCREVGALQITCQCSRRTCRLRPRSIEVPGKHWKIGDGMAAVGDGQGNRAPFVIGAIVLRAADEAEEVYELRYYDLAGELRGWFLVQAVEEAVPPTDA